MEHTVYLDNAATTFPKPEEVYEALDMANRELAFNAGRGTYNLAKKATDLIICRLYLLCNIIHFLLLLQHLYFQQLLLPEFPRFLQVIHLLS